MFWESFFVHNKSASWNTGFNKKVTRWTDIMVDAEVSGAAQLQHWPWAGPWSQYSELTASFITPHTNISALHRLVLPSIKQWRTAVFSWEATAENTPVLDSLVVLKIEKYLAPTISRWLNTKTRPKIYVYNWSLVMESSFHVPVKKKKSKLGSPLLKTFYSISRSSEIPTCNFYSALLNDRLLLIIS